METLFECPICLERFDDNVKVPMLIPCKVLFQKIKNTSILISNY